MKNPKLSIVLVAGFAIALTLQGCEGCKKHADQPVNSAQTSAANEPQAQKPTENKNDTPPPVDFENGIAIGIPRTPSSETQGAWVIDFNVSGEGWSSQITVACVGGMQLEDGTANNGSFSSGNCSPSLEAGVPVRFHFIANDPLRNLYTIPDEFNTPKPKMLYVWQDSREFFHTSDASLGRGWKTVGGKATSITLNGADGTIQAFRFEGIHSEPPNLQVSLVLLCGQMVIRDRSNTHFETLGLTVTVSGCIPLDKMEGVTLATPNNELYYYGVNNDDDSLAQSHYVWVTP